MKTRTIPLLLILFVPFVVCEHVAAEAAKSAEINKRCGDLEFRYTPKDGVTLKVSGVAVINGSSLWIMAPHWTKRFYGAIDQPNLIKEATIDSFQGGYKITLHHYLPPEKHCPFQGTETFTLSPDNTFTVTLEFTFSQDIPAIFEWTVGNINPMPFIGMTYVATDDRLTTRSTVPLEAVSSRVGESTLARAFRSVRLDSHLGPVEILTDPRIDLLLLDYRKNKWALEHKPLFWLGIWERPLTPHTKYLYSVSFRFPQQPLKQSKEIAMQSKPVSIKPVDNAQTPNWSQDYIIPTPKHLRYTQSTFPLSSNTKIYVGTTPGAGIENAVAFLLQDLKELHAIKPQVIREEAPQPTLPDNVIVIGETSRYPLPAQLCQRSRLALPDNDEGYSLFVTDKLACVAAKTDRGIFYALTTLLQLVEVSENGIALKGAEISDYPALSFRGIHCLSGKNAGDQIAKALRTLLARFKINSLVWECEYIIWDSHPEIAHRDYGMSKTDACKVIDAARTYFIEIIPLVQSLGHSEWIFTNKQHLDLAEDPDTPYAYCPTNPATYDFIFSVYQEALDFFKPRYFHIGHDEVTTQGRFPYRSKPSGKSATELIMDDILKLHEWFAKKGVKMMLWGDMFLWNTEGTDACLAPSLEEARTRRALLPKDITIADWHYAAAEPADYETLKLWKDEGFTAIGASWYRPENIRNLANACVLYDALGFLETTWAGFNFNIDTNEKERYQYWAYIWAANYAWSGENTRIADLPFNAKQRFLDLWFEKKPLLKKRSGFLVDLRPLCNRRLDDDAQHSGWVGYGPDLDFSAFPTGQNSFGETQFLVQKNDAAAAAVLLAGTWNPTGAFPQKVEIPLANPPVRAGSSAAELHFLINAAFRTSDLTQVGEIVITYANGSTDWSEAEIPTPRETIKLIYGKNIFAFDDMRTGTETRIAWRGKSKSATHVCAWDLTWKNPHPQRQLASITLRSAGTEAAPILLAITGIN